MKKTELIKMIDEIIYDYELTGGIMPNTLDKAKRLINFDANEQSKEVCSHPIQDIWMYNGRRFCAKCNEFLKAN